MLAFIQRFLSAENSSRKRKRAQGSFSSVLITSSSNEEIDSLRDTIAGHNKEPYCGAEDREQSISELLAPADEIERDAKRWKGRLSVIEESDEPEFAKTNKVADGNTEMDTVGVDVGVMHSAMDLDIPARATHTDTNPHDGMVFDQDVWTWKGRNGLQT